MSKKVTAVNKSIAINGNHLCLATDGTIRYEAAFKGDDVSHAEVAVTSDGLKAIKRAVPILLEIERLESQLSKIKPGREGHLGPLVFEDEDGEPGIRVGCTTVYPNELAGYLKAIGLK